MTRASHDQPKPALLEAAVFPRPHVLGAARVSMDRNWLCRLLSGRAGRQRLTGVHLDTAAMFRVPTKVATARRGVRFRTKPAVSAKLPYLYPRMTALSRCACLDAWVFFEFAQEPGTVENRRVNSRLDQWL